MQHITSPKEKEYAPSIVSMIALAATTASGAYAQACSDRDSLTEHLTTKYGEGLSAGGMRDSQSVLEVWVSQDGQTWTLLLTQANGQSCIMAAGTNWRDELRTPTPQGEPS